MRTLLLLMAMTLSGAWSAAQGNLALARLEVGLWPEYDRADMLVIYRATIAPGAALPAVVKLRIPAAAGSPNAVAEERTQGLVSLAYDREVDGEWAVITFTATVRDVQIEYYDPALQRVGASRSYTFRWPGDHAVGEIEVTVQEPAGARDLATVPAGTGLAPGADGLLYYGVQLGGAREGDMRELQVTYEKDSDDLTVSVLPPAPRPATGSESPVAVATPRSDGVSDLWMAGGALLIAAGLLGGWALARGRIGGPGRPRPAAGGGGGRAVFCTKCGVPGGVADRFCHACGQPLTRP